MYRGTKLFKCTECGKKFFAPDIELGATALSMPQSCPKCNSVRTMPFSLFSFIEKSMYKDIWEQMENNKK